MPSSATVTDHGGSQPVPEICAGMILGEYEVESVVVKGAMSSVYSAIHPILGKRAAIKVLTEKLSGDATAVEAFSQEARDSNLCRHPNIVDVFAIGSLPDGRSYFVMEWLEGESLADRMEGGRLTLGECCDILIQVGEALDAVHAQHIVHLDLKPDNVYLVPVRGGRTLVKLLDFGIARQFEDGVCRELKPSLTHLQMISGTPAYVSPEQAQGRFLDEKSDCYSFGVLAFQMLLGALPFVAETLPDMLLLHVTEPPPRPSLLWPQIPRQLEALLLGLLAKDPRRRPTLASARDCLTELRDGSAGITTEAVMRPAPDAVTRRLSGPRRFKRRIAIGGVSAILLCAGCWLYGRRTLLASPSAPETGTLSVQVKVPAARVELDGKVVAQGMASVQVALDGAGPHVLTVTVAR